MLCKKRICFFLFVTAAVLAPALLGSYSSVSSPKIQADGGAPPPPLPWSTGPSANTMVCAS